MTYCAVNKKFIESATAGNHFRVVKRAGHFWTNPPGHFATLTPRQDLRRCCSSALETFKFNFRVISLFHLPEHFWVMFSMTAEVILKSVDGSGTSVKTSTYTFLQEQFLHDVQKTNLPELSLVKLTTLNRFPTHNLRCCCSYSFHPKNQQTCLA